MSLNAQHIERIGMPIGTIALQGNQYVIYDNGTRIVVPKNPSWIPGDRVDTSTGTVIARQEQTTLAIVRGRNKTHVFLFCPLLGSLYNPSIAGEHDIGTTWLLHIPSNVGQSPILLKSIGSVYDRRSDLDALIATYLYVPSLPFSNPSYQSPLYTRESHDQQSLDTFSIDPKGCKDADDAITVLPLENRVLVHIVDIHGHSPSLETEWKAYSKAFTLYLPHKNTHIFPSEDAEDRFSLKVGVPRPVITIDVRFKPDSAHVDTFDIYRSTIINKRAYTYEEVLPLLTSDISPLYAWCRAFMNHRTVNTLIIPSMQLTVDPVSGTLTGATAVTNVDMAHKFVEHLMVLANMLVSQHLSQHPQTQATYGRIPQRFHSKLKAVPDANPSLSVIVNSFLAIKSYASAKYDADQAGHFGLQVPTYTHFTSPIRRYFDCILHHMLAGAIYEDTALDAMLFHINQQERTVEGLQKLFRQWKFCDHLKVGSACKGVVTAVNRAGIYFLIEELMLDGFVHVSKLMGKRWSYSEDTLTSDADVLCIGSPLALRVELVNQVMSTIDWLVLE